MLSVLKNYHDFGMLAGFVGRCEKATPPGGHIMPHPQRTQMIRSSVGVALAQREPGQAGVGDGVRADGEGGEGQKDTTTKANGNQSATE